MRPNWTITILLLGAVFALSSTAEAKTSCKAYEPLINVARMMHGAEMQSLTQRAGSSSKLRAQLRRIELSKLKRSLALEGAEDYYPNVTHLIAQAKELASAGIVANQRQLQRNLISIDQLLKKTMRYKALIDFRCF